MDRILKDLRSEEYIDPDFVDEFAKVTTESSNAGTWVAVMYRYDVNVNYKIQGRTLSTVVNGFGNAGTPDELDVTTYYKDGDYSTLTDVASQCNMPVWNSNNVFSYDEIKNALKSVIEDELPSGWSSYQSESWTVSAFLVPIFSVDIDFEGKEYTLNYNLHNGHYYYTFPTDKRIIKKAKTTNLVANIISWLCPILSVLAFIIGVQGENAQTQGYVFAIIGAIISAIVLFARKKRRTKAAYEKYYKKHKKTPIAVALIPEIIVGVITFFCFILTFLAS